MGFCHEYRVALETVEALALAEGRASQGGAARETQIARSIGAILARAGAEARVVARAGELPAAIEPEQQAAARGDVRFFELIPEEVRSKVTTWSDFSDDWSVDGVSRATPRRLST